jgi:hypothetical protein
MRSGVMDTSSTGRLSVRGLEPYYAESGASGNTDQLERARSRTFGC